MSLVDLYNPHLAYAVTRVYGHSLVYHNKLSQNAILSNRLSFQIVWSTRNFTV